MPNFIRLRHCVQDKMQVSQKFTDKLRTSSKGLNRLSLGPRQANLVLIAYASSEGSGEPAHPRSLARTSADCPYKQ